MSECIIISRFNEDLSWLKMHNNFKIIIYNKGNLLKNEGLGKVINIENIGRESHTWLYHIVENYNNLDDINIFLQGRIDDLNCMAYKNPNDYIKVINKYGFAASRYGLLGPFHWKWNVGLDISKKYKRNWERNEISRSNIGFRRFAKNIFPNIPILVATSYGGCFAVKKESILQYDITFYKILLAEVSRHKNPIEGHYMERLWCFIFTKNKLIFRAIRDVILTKLERIFLKINIKI